MQFAGYEAVIQRSTYTNGSVRLTLAKTSGTPLAVATTALDELPAEGNVFIKDWGENMGMLAALQSAGIVGEVVREIRSGFVTVYEASLEGKL